MAMRAEHRANRSNLGFLLAKASQRWNEVLYEQFCAAGYPEVRPSYGSVLLPLFEEDGLRMTDLAQRARLSKQTMTTLVRLLEREGLVRRERHPDDGRAFRISLTDRARRFQPVADDVLADMDRLVRARVTQRELQTLESTLRKVMQL